MLLTLVDPCLSRLHLQWTWWLPLAWSVSCFRVLRLSVSRAFLGEVTDVNRLRLPAAKESCGLLAGLLGAQLV